MDLAYVLSQTLLAVSTSSDKTGYLRTPIGVTVRLGSGLQFFITFTASCLYSSTFRGERFHDDVESVDDCGDGRVLGVRET